MTCCNFLKTLDFCIFTNHSHWENKGHVLWGPATPKTLGIPGTKASRRLSPPRSQRTPNSRYNSLVFQLPLVACTPSLGTLWFGQFGQWPPFHNDQNISIFHSYPSLYSLYKFVITSFMKSRSEDSLQPDSLKAVNHHGGLEETTSVRTSGLFLSQPAGWRRKRPRTWDIYWGLTTRDTGTPKAKNRMLCLEGASSLDPSTGSNTVRHNPYAWKITSTIYLCCYGGAVPMVCHCLQLMPSFPMGSDLFQIQLAQEPLM